MEAKDTVMSPEQLQIILLKCCGDISCSEEALKLWKTIAQDQAEITAPIFYAEGHKAGIREVVEWLQPQLDIGYADNLITIGLDRSEWNTKLKAWGIEETEKGGKR